MARNSPPLPEGCRVRIIDLPPGVNALISARPDGASFDILLNARLDGEARQRALRHELRHLHQSDLFSAADIREIEGDAPRGLRALGGEPLENPAPVFPPEALKPIGRGLYRPTGSALEKALSDLRALAAPLEAACRSYDIMQRPPELPVERLEACRAALLDSPEAAIAFVAWRPGPKAALPVVMQLCSPNGEIEGAIYYAESGEPDNALVMLCADYQGREYRVCVDIRRRGGALALSALSREVDGRGWERVY